MFFKKLSKLVLALSMVSTSVIGSIKVEAATNPVTATVSDDSIVVGNDFIERSFEIANGKVSTSAIKNKRIDSTLTPAEGSEDFVINALKPVEEQPVEPEPTETVPPTQALDQSTWSATVQNKDGTQFPQSSVASIFDGDIGSYPNEWETAGYPFTMDIDLGSVQTVRSMSVDKRPGYKESIYGTNGTMGKFELYVSDDGTTYTKAGQGEFTREAYNLHEANGLYNVGDRVYANFFKEYQTRYVRIKQLSGALSDAEEFSSAEINFYSDAASGVTWDIPEVVENPDDLETRMIKSSELTYKNATVTDYEGDGKRISIEYEPVTAYEVNYTIKQVLVVKPTDHYMRSFLEISVDDQEAARIDYIDIDRFVLTDATEGVWSHPDESKISSMWIGKHELVLGQPIYVEGMFMGSEFPAADTLVDETKATQVRYYSGKNFTRFNADNQLREDGTYVTWPNVIGSATGKDTSVVQTSFYEYIDDIATPTEFRKQYNSWYDNMQAITDDSVKASFNGAEKGLTQNGVEPLDSYVMDDGWINYYDGVYTKEPGVNQGTTPNQTGFWEFNAKFPNELYTSTSLASKLQSTFGLWLGPQGGYNYFSTFAQFMEANGTAYKQDPTNGGGYWTNICVGSTKYVNNLKNLFIDYQNRFNIDYWKWDGFQLRPCTNKAHDHMTGGYKNMYNTVDLWEKWIDLFEAVRAARAAQGKGLWINSTCYVNLSPWLLQWVNTIWMQDSGDTGELPTDGQIKSGDSVSTAARHQRKIYYRDEGYYKIFVQNQLQFPLKNLYNHDPIYGVSDGSEATDEVFRQFLFANAVRGTAFWELYFSPSLITEEKWDITADALEWAEENFHILQKAKLIGGRPQDGCLAAQASTNGVYGYSSWNGLEGIMAITNPTETTQTFTVVLDDKIGVSEELKGKSLAGYKVLPNDGSEVANVTYGDTWTVEVPAHETVIYQYGKVDTTAPVITNAVAKSAKTIDVRFNERVELSDDVFTVTNAAGDAIEVSATLNEDYHTVTLTATENLPEVIKVSTTVADTNGNKANDSKTIAATKDGVLFEADFDGLASEYNALSDTTWYSGMKTPIVENRPATNAREFAIRTAFKAEPGTNQNLVDLGSAKLALKDDVVEFTVGDQKLTSKETVTKVVEKAHGTFGTDEYVPTTTETSYRGLVDGKEHVVEAVREANGMLKIYFDGELASSAYDEETAEDFIEISTIKVGDTNFAGSIGKTQVLNYSFGYEESEDASTELQVKELDREGWTATACSEMPYDDSDGRAQTTLDGKLDSWWHTSYTGDDDCEMGEHWIQIDFGKDVTFDHFVHVGRAAGSNGIIKGYTLQAKNADGEFVTIKEGEFPGTSTKTVVKLDEMVTTSAIKLIPTSTQNGANYISAVELGVAKTDTELSSEDVATKKNEALPKYAVAEEDLKKYSTASADNYKEEYAKLANVTVASQYTFPTLEEKVSAAKEGLIDVTALRAKVAEAGAEDVTNKTPASKQALADAIENGNKVAEEALTDAEVTSAINAISAAVEGLKDIASKEAIDEAIATTTDLAEADHTAGSWADLQQAIKDAEAVKANDDATVDEITAAANAVTTAKDALVSTKALKDKVAEVKDTNLTGKTDETKAAFEEALKAANDTLAKADATPEEIAKAVADLDAAFAGLKDKPVVAKPAKVTGLKASKNTYSSVKLTWTKVKGATGYEITRSTKKDGTYGNKVVVKDVNTAIVNKLKTGQTYWFKVRAIKGDVKGDNCSAVSQKPIMDKAVVLVSVDQKTYGTLQVTWKGVAGAQNYYLERRVAGTKTWKHLKTFPSKARTAESRSLNTGTKYEYRVRASRNKGDERAYSPYSNVKSNTPVMKTTTVTVVKKAATSAKVSWKTVSGATGYEVYRATSSAGKYSKIKTLTAKSMENSKLVKGKTYYYKVRAYRNVNGKKVYNKFSKVVSYKVK